MRRVNWSARSWLAWSGIGGDNWPAVNVNGSRTSEPSAFLVYFSCRPFRLAASIMARMDGRVITDPFPFAMIPEAQNSVASKFSPNS